MIKNYLKTAWRNLLNNKSTSLISMAGLAVGICCFLLLITYIINELRYDRFNINADRIVRVAYSVKSADDKETRTIAVTQTAPVPVFKQEFDEIEDGVRIFNYSSSRPATIQYNDKLIAEKNVLAADPSFFKIFSFKFLKGNAVAAFSDPLSVVITQSIAKKYFGDENPVGKVLKVNQNKNLAVTGVIEDVPAYSQIKFDLMVNAASMESPKVYKWDSANNYSYLLLKPGVSMQSVQNKMNAYLDRLMKATPGGTKSWYTLEPLTNVHLRSKAIYGLEPGGNIKYIYILGIVALVLLLLACVNFLNLVTARSAERSKEIGVRKVMGALRVQLFSQFIIEAGIITFISLVTGVVITAFIFPLFSDFAGQQLSFSTWNVSWLALALITLLVGVTFLAGIYPSLYLSALKPVASLKGRSNSKSGGNMVRQSLVVFQFVVSVFFIISTLIAIRQLSYMRSLDTGINRQQIVVIDIGGMPFSSIEPFKTEISRQPEVLSSTASYDSPVNIRGGYTINSAEGKASNFELSVTAIPVEKNFTNTLGIKLIAGNEFNLSDEKQVQDTAFNNRRYSFILNETAIKAMGWTPEEAIGRRMNLNGRAGTIKGVAKDFNFASLHQEITPMVMFAEYDWFGKVLVKTTGRRMAATIENIQAQWKKFYPNSPFEYYFLDQEYEEMYKTEQRTGAILTAFTGVTIFISCLGLFGLAVFSTRQRIKEIGIRKVLGAGVLSITRMVSFEFLKLVIIAIIIASPLAYSFMRTWLQDFAFRIQIQWWIFALAGGLAIVIAFLTVGYQSVKAALSNPVQSIRSE
ncbi:ABC transporter permease [Mucilaginibacter litoreus]|uniref:ABC transporter permease n=1 Tax=Mucilaginibacter litoreus TaxID=1048221 RepID=A0ABW3ATX8_9SPHI